MMKCTVVKVLALLGAILGLANTLPAQTTLISTGAVWKYLDVGGDPGAGWTSANFADDSWLAGPGQLGFGDNDETTLLSPTNSAGVANIAYYFRHAFSVPTPATYTNLLLRLHRDDGAVVYLNDLEVFRSNMRPGPVDFNTLAPIAAPDDGAEIFEIAIAPSLLAAGNNLLAVEVHQSSTTSSDLSFELELLGNVTRSRLPLVHRGADWRYLDDGSDQGTAWRAPLFDDSSWSNGLAQLGFGDGDETSLIRRFSDLAGTNAITYYFRHAFNVANPAGITGLVARIVRDDGAIVYLNGTEIQRINMPAGAVSFTNFSQQVIGTDDSFHAVHVNPALLVPGRNVLAVEVHQFNLTSSDVSFNFELLQNQLWTPPSIAIVTPTNTATLIGPTNLNVTFLARDLDNPVASVALYVGPTLAGTDTTDAYDVNGINFSVVASNLAAGTYALRAVATDASGLTGTSAPVNITVVAAPSITRLIATNSLWKYLDTGVDQGTAWRAPSFDDSLWPGGQAKLGTNDLGTNTIIRIRNAAGMAIPTTYFRHYFVASNVATLTNLAFRVLRDDGCLVYLNGTEIFRMLMPTGTVTFNTIAPTAVGGADEFTFYPTNVSPSLLLNGTNVLAVELHQSSGTSDAGFDLELFGVAPPPNGVPPLTIQLNGNTVRVTWPGAGFILQESSGAGGPYNNLPAATSPYLISPPTGTRFYRLSKP